MIFLWCFSRIFSCSSAHIHINQNGYIYKFQPKKKKKNRFLFPSRHRSSRHLPYELLFVYVNDHVNGRAFVILMRVYLFELTTTTTTNRKRRETYRFQSSFSEEDGSEKLITHAVFSRLKIYG